MSRMRPLLLGFAAALIVAGATPPASGSTFVRVDLDYLAAENSTIIIGEVVDARSYWNEPGTLILTDVRVLVAEVLKGKLDDQEVTVTLPGGKVGDVASVVVGGAELIPGKSYILFLRQGSLPGAANVRTVSDHSQGVFEVRKTRDGLRAVSQAARMGLVPDFRGNARPPGGVEGLPFNAIVQSVRELVAQRVGRREVK